ncbi:DUF3852 domain-containing protein [Erysipelothrix anatis]|uniref:DUF3852 domain-containing protein n=1 Tax=Erysipelothrix anatis TaxID=2683713 RepID=UPI00135A9787|nr:DUF3852 domain-containing protein [Erysipelothrix anatis]
MIKKLTNPKVMKWILSLLFITLLLLIFVHPTYAQGNVSGVIEETWNNAESQIRQVVNNVIFPALSIILAIFFFVKLGSSYFDYKRNNDRFEWTAPAILFVCLVFTLTAPTYIWRLL